MVMSRRNNTLSTHEENHDAAERSRPAVTSPRQIISSPGAHIKAIGCPYLPLISVIVFFLVVFGAFHSELVDTCLLSWDCQPPQDAMLQHYCSSRIEGEEGPFHGAEQYRLQHVVLNIRHGDRSPLFTIPGLLQHKREGNQGLNSRDVKFLRNLSAFHLQPLEDYKHRVLDPLNSTYLDYLASYDVQLGQLTVAGFMQHISLGRHLRKSYVELLGKIKSPDQIFIKSTNFERTIQSAAALLLGMVPKLTRPGRKKDITIHYHPYKRDEAMHGVGLRRKRGLNLCPAAVSARDRQFLSNESFDSHISADHELVKVFGPEVAGQKMVDMMDVILPGYCHGRHLPCTKETSLKTRDESVASRGSVKAPACVSLKTILEMKAQSDLEFCHIYGGSNGGLESSRLSIYPFMMQIKRNLFHAADLDVHMPNDNFVTNMGKEEEKLGLDRSFGSALEHKILTYRQLPKEKRPVEQDVLFTLYSGHDTVIAPVLAVLGVYDKFCDWPPYASHIAFELWKNNRKASRNRPANETARDFYVRVLYNGRDVTRHIPACAAAAVAARLEDEQARREDHKRNSKITHHHVGELDLSANERASSKYKDPNFEKMYDNSHLCSLKAFANQIDGLLDGARTMTEACHRKNINEN